MNLWHFLQLHAWINEFHDLNVLVAVVLSCSPLALPSVLPPCCVRVCLCVYTHTNTHAAFWPLLPLLNCIFGVRPHPSLSQSQISAAGQSFLPQYPVNINNVMMDKWKDIQNSEDSQNGATQLQI